MGKPYTQEEIDYIRKSFPDMESEIIANRLGISRYRVDRMAYRVLHLKKTKAHRNAVYKKNGEAFKQKYKDFPQEVKDMLKSHLIPLTKKNFGERFDEIKARSVKTLINARKMELLRDKTGLKRKTNMVLYTQSRHRTNARSRLKIVYGYTPIDDGNTFIVPDTGRKIELEHKYSKELNFKFINKNEENE